MEISEAFQQTQMYSNCNRSKTSPKRSPKCNGHVGLQSTTTGGFHEMIQDSCNKPVSYGTPCNNDDTVTEAEHQIHNKGDISFIPLQERGILIRGRIFCLHRRKFLTRVRPCGFETN